jgi:hypothetical protein
MDKNYPRETQNERTNQIFGTMTRLRQHSQQRTRRRTTVAVGSLFVLLLLLPPQRTIHQTTGFAHGFVPIHTGATTTTTTTTVASAQAHTHNAQCGPTTTTLAAVSGLFDTVEATDAAFGFDAPPSMLTSSEIWALRIGSGLLTYFGFVFATDRPKGQMAVPLVDDSNVDGCLKVAPSTVPGAGLGLFVTQSMPKGTFLGTYPGVVIPLGQHSASSKIRDCPDCASYIWRFTDNQFIIDPTNHNDGTLGMVCKGGNPSQLLSVTFFDILSVLGLWRGVPTALCRINEPPKGRDVNVVTEEDLETRTVTFALERDVFAGEELHIDYGLTYDRSGYGGNSGSGM